jgi:uncharacterized membrane protein
LEFASPVFKRNVGIFTGILLTMFGAWVALEIVVIAGQRFGIFLWVAAHLAFLIFVAGIELGFLKVCLTLYDGRQPTFSDSFAYLSQGPKFLVGQLLYVLMSALGLLLLVVPGVYFSVRYVFFGFCMIVDETSLVRSFRQSAIVSAGAGWQLLGILVALLIVNVIGASFLGLGLLASVPLSVLTMTAIYRQLRES